MDRSAAGLSQFVVARQDTSGDGEKDLKAGVTGAQFGINDAAMAVKTTMRRAMLKPKPVP